MKRILLDVNVVLDVLADRKPFAEKAVALFGVIETGAVHGFIAAHTVTTLYYLLATHLGKAKTRRVLMDLLRLLRVVEVNEDRLRHALGLNWTDFEDAVQAACAEKAEADYLVTRDKTGFKKSAVRPVTPGELLALIHE